MRGRGGLGCDVVEAGVVLVGGKLILLRRGGCFVVERGPGLARGRDVLAGVVADGAVWGWGGEGGVELGAAREANGEVAAGVVHCEGW